jgi:hypothetical protein
MVSIGTPAFAALDDDTLLVECAVKDDVSIPSSPNISFIHRPSEDPVIALWGWTVAINKLREFFRELQSEDN